MSKTNISQICDNDAEVGSMLPHPESLDGLDEVDLDIESHYLQTTGLSRKHSVQQTKLILVKKWWNLKSITNIAVGSILLNVLMALTLASRLAHSCECSDPSLQVYSPVHHLVEYETKVLSRRLDTQPSPYQGLPSDDLDLRWKGLYNDSLTLEISEEEKSKMVNNTIRAPYKGHHDSFMIGLSVFHELRCLDQIRMALHPGHYELKVYNENGTANAGVWSQIDICIDYLREVAMCNADPHPYVFLFQPIQRHTKIRYDTAHTCRNFEALHEWAKERDLGYYDEMQYFEKFNDIVPLDYGP